jgi:ligand-binding sensor domain-containing protein
LLQQLPCPLKYISTVIEIEAYGPLLDASAEIPPFAGITYPERYTGKWQIYRADETDGMESDYVWMAEVDENYIWFGSSCGLLCYDKEKDKWTTYRIPFRPGDSQGILALAVEKDKIWVGTSSHFYNLIDLFYGYTEQQAETDKSEMEELLTKWALWTTEQKDGIYTLDKETKKWTVIAEGFNNVSRFRNKIIAYRRDGKPLIYEVDIPEYPLEEVFFIKEELWKWVSAKGGLRERRLKGYVQDVPKSMAKNLPATLVRQNDGDYYRISVPMGFSVRLYFPPHFIFYASTDSGVVVGNALHDSHKVSSWRYSYSRRYLEADGLSNQNIQDMLNDGDYVWMATVDGVSRLDLLTDTWERFNVKDGLPHRLATCIAVDDDSVWVGTRQGIARYRKIFFPEEIIR